jgi:hypothetical protein
MKKNASRVWANAILQVFMHVPSFWAHVLEHTCSSSKKCPAGILKQLSELKPATTSWGNEHCDEVFQHLDDCDDASEALTKLFTAMKECEGEDVSAKVSVDRLVGIRLKTTIMDCKGHESDTPSTYNYGFMVDVSSLSIRTPIQNLLDESSPPVTLLDYACDKCPTKVPAKKTTTYLPPPPAVLCVVLTQDSSGPGVHFVKPVHLPGTKVQYNLAAVVCFKSHYWAIVKKGADMEPVWIKADDEKATSITLKTLRSPGYGTAAEILIYEQVDAVDSEEKGKAKLVVASSDPNLDDDDDDALDPATRGTVQTLEPGVSPPPQTSNSGTPRTQQMKDGSIDLTMPADGAEAVAEAPHTHITLIRIIVCSNIVHHFRNPMIRPL